MDRRQPRPSLRPARPAVTWTTEYYGLAVELMRAEGRSIEDEILGHISRRTSEKREHLGSIPVDIDRELAKLDSAGYRPFREPKPAG